MRPEDGEEFRESFEARLPASFDRVRSDEVDSEVDKFGIDEDEEEAPVGARMKVGWAGELELIDDEADPGVGGESPVPVPFTVRC